MLPNAKAVKNHGYAKPNLSLTRTLARANNKTLFPPRVTVALNFINSEKSYTLWRACAWAPRSFYQPSIPKRRQSLAHALLSRAFFLCLSLLSATFSFVNGIEWATDGRRNNARRVMPALALSFDCAHTRGFQFVCLHFIWLLRESNAQDCCFLAHYMRVCVSLF